jgi:hypothetical protein
VRRLTLWAGQDSTASRKVADKLGFTHRSLDWKPEGGLGTFEAKLPAGSRLGRNGRDLPRHLLLTAMCLRA